MARDWTKFQAKVQSDLHPILIHAGYILRSAESIKDDDSFVFWYEKEDTDIVTIDVLEWISFEKGTREDFNWVRVHFGATPLKALIGLSSDTDMILYDGWKWVTDAELDACVEEIAHRLKTYLDSRSSL